jgi:Cys-tRNA(Pro) deacylase
VKTLVMQDQDAHPLLVLMHGDRKVSLKNLARQIGAKSVQPCTPEAAQRHTGYQVGGTSPFGTRKNFPVYVERSILSLPKIFINGGRRGFLVGIDPQVLITVLKAQPCRKLTRVDLDNEPLSFVSGRRLTHGTLFCTSVRLSLFGKGRGRYFVGILAFESRPNLQALWRFL